MRAREGQPGVPWRGQGPAGLQTPMDKGTAAQVQTKQRTVLKERASLPFYQEIHYSAYSQGRLTVRVVTNNPPNLTGSTQENFSLI